MKNPTTTYAIGRPNGELVLVTLPAGGIKAMREDTALLQAYHQTGGTYEDLRIVASIRWSADRSQDPCGRDEPSIREHFARLGH